ncbi:MAG TPA: hypothetical protein VK578_24425 [Edaphobacter sp.]|jgi:hypothetical protein|nr:hypothetical protein [Edaphobacter sp.]
MDELPLGLPEECIETVSVESGYFHPTPLAPLPETSREIDAHV